jgi:hypothetical protein
MTAKLSSLQVWPVQMLSWLQLGGLELQSFCDATVHQSKTWNIARKK